MAEQAKRLKILLIEDGPEDARAVRDALAQAKEMAVDLEWADALPTGLERLDQDGFDLVLTDLCLPGSKGLETFLKVRTHAKEVPVVVLTSSDDDTLATQAVKEGAQDYVVKGYVQVYPNLLIRSMRYAIERRRAEQKEKELAAAAASAATEKARATELAQAYQELQHAHAMLVQAEKMAAVGQLASGIAHEVKNPLGIILNGVSYLEMSLGSQNGDSQAAEVIQMIKEAVQRSDKLIRGLLDFSRPAPLELKPGQISHVITSSLELVQKQLTVKNIDVSVDIDPTLPQVLLDENQMKQVFINMILNAFQAMPNGGTLSIQASLKTLTEVGGKVGSRATDVFQRGQTVLVCEVRDTGTGIPKELLSKIFEPFFTTKPPGQGTGLGLAITVGIIERHRGAMEIQSQEGKGTTMIVMLPLITQDEPQPAHANP